MNGQDAVKAYIEKEAPEFDEAWALSKKMESIPLPQASPSLTKTANDFRDFMHNFLSKSNDKELKQVFTAACTWKDVQNEATQAFRKYEGDGKSWKHPFKGNGRAFSDVACRFEFLILVLPNGDYTSLVCGALKLVFNAARRMKSIRESVFKTFDGLSDTIDSTNVYIRAYSQDEVLQVKAENLYVAILEAVKAMTGWLGKNPLAESFKAFFQQSEYGKKLEEQMTTNIQDAASSFEERIKALLHLKVENIDRTVADISSGVGDVNRKVSNVDQKMVELFKQGFKMVTSLEDQLSSIAADVDWKYERLAHMFKEGLSKVQESPQSITANVIFMPTMPAIPQSIITVQQLLNILDTRFEQTYSELRESVSKTISQDREIVSHFGRTLDHTRQKGIAAVMQEPQFQRWLKSTHSQTLVINGMEMDSHSLETISPMSYMSYLLSETLARLQPATLLNFYCGLHSAPGSSVEGVSGMLRSIIAQLLLAYGQQVNLSFLDFAAIQNLQKHDILQLCLVLQSLLRSINIGVVFLIIDGISWYESEYRILEMAWVMRFLNSLVEAIEASQTGFVFKLLLTSPVMSQYSREWFPGAEEIFMQGNMMLEGAQDGFDEFQMLMAGQNILGVEDQMMSYV